MKKIAYSLWHIAYGKRLKFQAICHKPPAIRQTGMSVIEVVLAAAIFTIFASSAVSSLLTNYQANRTGAEFSVATQYAAEGLEAVKSIKNQAYTNLNSPQGGVRRRLSSPFTWEFFGANNTFNAGKTYTRTIAVTDVQRDCVTKEIATSGTTYIDPDTHKVTSTVNWEFNPGAPGSRSESVSFSTYLTDWKKPISAGTLGGGMLIYGDGGTTSDAFRYKTLDPVSGLWSAAGLIDFDPSAANKAVRAVRIDASFTRNEKIVMSRHLAGTNAQSIWIHVWNGSSWASQQLSSWTSNANTDVRNFDGAYLNNGNYVAVYSDNSSTPKYKVWDGYCWTAQQDLVNLANNGSGIPLYIVVKRRPNTNELMAAFFGTARDTNTQYYNGSSWTLHSRHASTGPAQREMIDFVWNPQNPLKGMLIYNSAASGTSSRMIDSKVFTADGLGGGSWSSQVSSPATNNTLGAMSVDSRTGGEEFLGCAKNNSSDIYCYRANATPSWTTPTNNILSANTDAGIQRSYDFAYEALTGNLGISVFSDTTAIPKLKKYTVSTNTFDSANTNMGSIGVALESVRLRPAPNSDDIMILMGNTSNDLYTQIWNGSSDVVYTIPSGKDLTAHQPSTSGSADTDFFYDFAWDKY